MFTSLHHVLTNHSLSHIMEAKSRRTTRKYILIMFTYLYKRDIKFYFRLSLSFLFSLLGYNSKHVVFDGAQSNCFKGKKSFRVSPKPDELCQFHRATIWKHFFRDILQNINACCSISCVASSGAR